MSWLMPAQDEWCIHRRRRRLRLSKSRGFQWILGREQPFSVANSFQSPQTWMGRAVRFLVRDVPSWDSWLFGYCEWVVLSWTARKHRGSRSGANENAVSVAKTSSRTAQSYDIFAASRLEASKSIKCVIVVRRLCQSWFATGVKCLLSVSCSF